ncbi:hypothetical protein K0A96_01700 [Patescibacteria group bacterium]|nr:hypothetical protein [Patescibacteria group bacterium]
METLTSTKFDWKKVLVVIMLVILAGVTTAGITWYMMDARNAEENEQSQSEITELKIKVSELESGQEGMVNPEGCDCNETEEDEVSDGNQAETETETEEIEATTPVVPTQ